MPWFVSQQLNAVAVKLKALAITAGGVEEGWFGEIRCFYKILIPALQLTAHGGVVCAYFNIYYM